jgi:hypothetical protein
MHAQTDSGTARGSSCGAGRTSNQGDNNVRRLISAMALALAAGLLIIVSPTASAAIRARLTASPGPQGTFGVRLVDVPVSETDNPRALRYIIDYLPVGTVIHRRILVLNQEPRTARFSVYPDAAHISGGLFIGDAGATRNELTNWISVQHPSVTLPPGASVMDMITIKVPRGATRGEHYAVIWVQQAAKALTSRDSGVTEVFRVGMRVYLAVGRGGAPPTSFAITSMTVRQPSAGQPIMFVAHVRNTGGRAVDLSGSIRLADGPGNTSSGPFPAQRIVTLAPGQSGNITFAPPKELPYGSWRATVTLMSGITTATATTTIQFSPTVSAQAGLPGMQWVWLGLGSLAILLVIAMVGYSLLHRRRQLPA